MTNPLFSDPTLPSGSSSFGEKIIGFFKKIYKFIYRQYKIDKMRFNLVVILLSLAALGGGVSGYTYVQQKHEYQSFTQSSKEVSWREYLDILQDKEVAQIQYNLYRTTFAPFGAANTLSIAEVMLKNGQKFNYQGGIDTEKTKELNKIVFDKNITEKKLAIDHAHKDSALNSLISTIFFIMGMVVLLLMGQRAFSDVLVGKDFNLTRNDESIKFTDIIGYEEVKQEFTETVDKLKKYEQLKSMGISTPRGILLTGGPGVGKTMFAKALANEVNAGFLYATGADFVELYVGTGARRVRNLFANARHMAPCVIFIDEIDALGKRDGFGMDAERLATINQILAEMDGMNENKAILVVAATNHMDKIDSALLRPGRFDKKINIPNPDLETREKILRFYNSKTQQKQSGTPNLSPVLSPGALVAFQATEERKEPTMFEKDTHNAIVHFEPNVSIEDVLPTLELLPPQAHSPNWARFARITAGMSGAELKNLIDAARDIYIRQHENITDIQLSNEDLEEALEVILLGVSKNKANPKELERVAIHELGHAIVGHTLNTNAFVQKISIAGRGQALGYTMQTPKEELRLMTPTELRSQITALLGGRAAEEFLLGEVSSGCADDLQRANTIAQKMVESLGMGKRVGLFATLPVNPHQPSTQLNVERIEEDIHDILQECYSVAQKIVREHKDWLEAKKILLIEKISLEHEELFSI